MQMANRFSSSAVDPEKFSPQLKDLYRQCVQNTKHPELGADILYHIKSVVPSKHKLDKFEKDVEFFEYEFTAKATSRSMAAGDLPPFRQIIGIATEDEGMLDYITPSDALRIEVSRRTNCWYQMGKAIHIKTRSSNGKVLFALLRLPELSNEKFYSWLVEEQPNAIIDEVCAIIAGLTGESERQQVYSDRVRLVHTPEILKEQLMVADVLAQTLSDYRRQR